MLVADVGVIVAVRPVTSPEVAPELTLTLNWSVFVV
jgi:hypothetical protein